MAQKSKYADISDIDDAPEYYQTPDSPRLAEAEEDNSDSDSSDYDEDHEQRIDRKSTAAEQARKHFHATKIDARGVDFSDRLHRKRRSYKTSHKQVRRKDASKIGDFSDEEDENLARKLARLQREIKQIEEEFERKKKEREDEGESEEDEDSDDEDEDEAEEEDVLRKIQRMSEALDKVYLQRRRLGSSGAEVQLARTAKKFSKATSDMQAVTRNGLDRLDAGEDFLNTPVTPSAAQAQQRHALARAADFDVRLSALEVTLGLNALNMPETGKEPQRSILYTLEALDTQVAALATPASTALETAGRKLQKMTQDLERLESFRKGLQPQPSRTSKLETTAQDADTEAPLDAATLTKINELYKVLPAIETLSPTLPMVVERLRTLRLIHTSAGSAHATLDEIDKRQMEQAAEIKRWRETLLQIEKGLEKGEESFKKNVGSMGIKVRALEERLGKLE